MWWLGKKDLAGYGEKERDVGEKTWMPWWVEWMEKSAKKMGW